MLKHILVAVWRLIHTTCTLLVAAFVLPVVGGSEQLFFALVDVWWLLLVAASVYAMARFVREVR